MPGQAKSPSGFLHCIYKEIADTMVRVGAIAILATLAACTVGEDERCSEGRVWSPEYRGCVAPDASAAAATGTVPVPVTDAGPGAALDAASDGASGQGSNLGAVCTSDADCADGVAMSCLLNPQAPADPGVCTITHCNSAACGDSWDCCDCTASPVLSGLWAASQCIPAANVSQLTALSCTCT
jgi:hypothetical protein